MVINQVIIHRIIKERNTRGATYKEGKKLLPTDSPIVIKVVDDIFKLFGKRENTATYGTFEESPTKIFPKDFQTYIHSSRHEDNFKAIALCALTSLTDKAASETFSTGGYLLVADYKSQNKNYLMVAMIKERPGVMINDDLEPTEQMEIDLSKLHQACKINQSLFSDYISSPDTKDNAGYLKFVSQKTGKDASDYFLEGLGCKKGSNAKKATDAVIKGTHEFFRKTPTLQKDALEARESVARYLDENINNGPVTLENIGHVVSKLFPPEDADELFEKYIGMMNDEDHQVPAQFNVNNEIIKRYKKVKVTKENGFDLNFDRTLFGTTPRARVYYDEKNNKLTFTLKEQHSEIEQLVKEFETRSNDTRAIRDIQQHSHALPETE
ncbi:nucleoid-associated protein [Endozoicomonas gorgoniicola]|uniref:Nucleoid-associated protein n=1 Tax=Endozoicomonas gorgoniicola TaxID=1234144 RepID=A0ABT3MYJ9_9GAMM|nr:nucleoid-associated protein [Endozoicomonas gorgoniicola]MCW7554439.1 nucleoid-associated protein [Endozoicomonas gorgoniicola]